MASFWPSRAQQQLPAEAAAESWVYTSRHLPRYLATASTCAPGTPAHTGANACSHAIAPAPACVPHAAHAPRLHAVRHRPPTHCSAALCLRRITARHAHRRRYRLAPQPLTRQAQPRGRGGHGARRDAPRQGEQSARRRRQGSGRDAGCRLASRRHARACTTRLRAPARARARRTGGWRCRVACHRRRPLGAAATDDGDDVRAAAFVGLDARDDAHAAA